MPSIRHLAIKCTDPFAMAQFYAGTFDMHEVAHTDRTVYMSDGVINLALLPLHDGEKPGIDHFGFLVEDMEEMRKRLAVAEVPEPTTRPADGRYAEFRTADPEGNGIDLGVNGWYTEAGQGLASTESAPA